MPDDISPETSRAAAEHADRGEGGLSWWVALLPVAACLTATVVAVALAVRF